MAENIGNVNAKIDDAVENAKQKLDALSKEAAAASEATADFKKSMAASEAATKEHAKLLGGLRSPLLSSIQTFIDDFSKNKQLVELKKLQLQETQSSLARIKQQNELALLENQRKRDLYSRTGAAQQALEEQQAEIKREIESLRKLAQIREKQIKAKQEEIQQNDSVIASLQQEEEALQAEVARLKEASAGYSGPNPFLAAAEQRLAGVTQRLSVARQLQDSKASELAILQERMADIDEQILEQQQAEAGNNQQLAQLTRLRAEAEAERTRLLQEASRTESEAMEAQKKAAAELKSARIKQWLQNLNNTSTVLNNMSAALNKAVEPIRKTQQAFGIAAGQALQLNIGNFSQSLRSYANVFSGLAPVTAEEIQSAQQAFQAEFGGVLTPAAGREIATTAKQLGVTTSQLAVARRQFMTSTMGNVGAAAAQQDKFISEFQKKGLTSKDALDAIAQNSEVFARNGTRFATSFARAAADAKKIGVDLGKIDQVGDNIIGDFEGFLEKTAELGAMGFGFDSQRLAEIAESGDTGALMGELRSQLAAQGKDLTNLRRSEQLALSQAFGIPMAELQRLAQQQTDGSGEQLTSQEQATTFLSKLVNLVEKFSGILSIIAGAITGVLTASSVATALNTARIAVGGALTGGGMTGFLKNMFLGGGSPAGGAVAKTATEGVKAAAGPVASVASAATSAAPAAGQAAGGATSGISKLSSGINPTSLIKGAAAMVIMAGALWILGKALQQFSKVGLREVGVAAAAITIMAVLMAGLGALMSSGIGAGAILLGVGALILMAGAVYLMGKALQSVGNSSEGISKLSSSFDLLASAVGKLLAMDLDDLDKIKDLAKAGVGQTATALAKKAGVPEAVPGTTVATPGVSVTTPPSATTTPLPTVNVDFTRLEQKLDQVVKVIGSMKVELDGVKVGNIMANTSSNVRLAGVLGAST